MSLTFSGSGVWRRPRLLALTTALTTSVALLGAAGCRSAAPQGPSGSQALTTTDPAQRRQVEQRSQALLLEVRELETIWRSELGERRRLRERIAHLGGEGTVGMTQKRLQAIAHGAGAKSVVIGAQASEPLGPILRAYPLVVRGEGTWQQLGAILAQIEGGEHELVVLRYDLTRIREARAGQGDWVRLEAKVAVLGRGDVPPPVAEQLPGGPIPADPGASVHVLTDRLLSVRSAISAGHKDRLALEEGLAVIETASAPVRALVGPLGKLLGDARPERIACDASRFRLEGTVADRQAVEALRERLAGHALLHSPEIGEEKRQPQARGWNSRFVILARLGAEAAPPASGEVQPAPAASEEPAVRAPEPAVRAPEPAPYIPAPSEAAAPPSATSPDPAVVPTP